MERERMCIACRQMKDKRELLRIVKSKEGEIAIDESGKKNGRGAYICKSPECLNKLKRQRILNKAFKMNVEEKIYNQIEEALLGNK